MVRYREIASTVEKTCEDCNRNPSEVTLVAVSKTVGPDAIGDALAQGAMDFGENRPDRLKEMAERFPNAHWHFIGNIQSRRIRDIVGRAYLIHSLIELRHAEKISAVAEASGLVQPVLLEVNISGEASKSGLRPEAVGERLAQCLELPGIAPWGLMTMAPQGDKEAARATFRGLRELRDSLQATLPLDNGTFTALSMGMSEDWPVAIEEGATFVRIGRSIFS